MANSDLQGSYFKIASPILKKNIEDAIIKYGDKAKVLLGIKERDFHISYENMKKLKHFFDNPENKKKPEWEYKGGDDLKRFIESELNSKRTGIKQTKKIKSDIGFENQFIKNHSKQNLGTSSLKLKTKDLSNMKKQKLKLEETIKMMKENEDKKVYAACVVLLNKDKEILLLKRNDTDEWMPSKWGFPGGKVENDENCLDGCIRETKEETGIDVTGIKETSHYKEVPEGIVKFCIAYTNEDEPKVTISDEHTEYKWVNMNDIKDLDTIPEVLEDIMKTIQSVTGEKEDLNELYDVEQSFIDSLKNETDIEKVIKLAYKKGYQDADRKAIDMIKNTGQATKERLNLVDKPR